MSGHMYFFGIHNQQLSVFQLYAAENRALYFLSFLCIPFYFRRAGGPHISTMFYTCNMQKRENKAIFLRISGEMAKKRRNMQSTAKRNVGMQGFAPRNHPRQACSLDCIAKLRFAFQPALPAIQSHQTFRSSRQAHLLRQPVTIFRHPASFLQSKSQPSLSQQPPFRRQPASTHPPSIFSYRPHSLPSSNTQQQPAGFTCRLPIPSPLHFSFSFFPLFFLFFFSYFSEIILNTGSSSTGSSGL